MGAHKSRARSQPKIPETALRGANVAGCTPREPGYQARKKPRSCTWSWGSVYKTIPATARVCVWGGVIHMPLHHARVVGMTKNVVLAVVAWPWCCPQVHPRGVDRGSGTGMV